MTWMRTYSGRFVDLVKPDPAAIDIADIAHHLALISRFNGATPVPMTVAHHSMMVAQLLAHDGHGPEAQLIGLMHDAHEAYMGDLTRPLKQALGAAGQAIETGLDHAIRLRLSIPAQWATRHHDVVMAADNRQLAAEWRDLMHGPCPVDVPPSPFAVRPLNWSRAEEHFLNTFQRLAMAAALNFNRFNPMPSGIAT